MNLRDHEILILGADFCGKKIESEYMKSEPPAPPRCICKTKIHQQLGIISPSLYQRYLTGADENEEEREQVKEYMFDTLKYRCCKRKMRKDEWKALYRHARKKKRREKDV